MTPGQRLRQLANVLNGSTPLGLLLARLAGTRTVGGPRGLVIATGYGWRLPFAGAFTVGNVIIYRAGPDAALANPVLLQHEERHSTQYAWFLGMPFVVLYLLAAVWSVLRTGDPASENPFERQAGLAAGGYMDRGRRRPRGTAGRTSGSNAGRTSGGNAGEAAGGNPG
jgi:hypothetical protein